MSEMVERVARAIYAQHPNFGMEWRPNTAGGHSQVRVDDAWEDAPDRHEMCREQARAAIEAMRTPGDDFASYVQLAHDLRPEDWSELVDAALTDPSSPSPGTTE